MSTTPARVIRDVKRGAIMGAGTAGVFSLWAVLVYAVRGTEPFTRHGVSLTTVLLTYIGVGLSAGTVVGLLNPLAQKPGDENAD